MKQILLILCKYGVNGLGQHKVMARINIGLLNQNDVSMAYSNGYFCIQNEICYLTEKGFNYLKNSFPYVKFETRVRDEFTYVTIDVAIVKPKDVVGVAVPIFIKSHAPYEETLNEDEALQFDAVTDWRLAKTLKQLALDNGRTMRTSKIFIKPE